MFVSIMYILSKIAIEWNWSIQDSNISQIFVTCVFCGTVIGIYVCIYIIQIELLKYSNNNKSRKKNNVRLNMML